MRMLITRVEPHFPPTLTWDPAPGAEPAVAPTYGGHLLTAQFDHVDANMGLTIARCMAHAPDDRPDMAWLIKDLEDNVGRMNALSTPLSDEQLLAGCLELFAEPSGRRKVEPEVNASKPFDGENLQVGLDLDGIFSIASLRHSPYISSGCHKVRTYQRNSLDVLRRSRTPSNW